MGLLNRINRFRQRRKVLKEQREYTDAAARRAYQQAYDTARVKAAAKAGAQAGARRGAPGRASTFRRLQNVGRAANRAANTIVGDDLDRMVTRKKRKDDWFL